jgi:hypothetical protein
MGTLPKALGGLRLLFVAINMFTKWMEAMLVVNITQDNNQIHVEYHLQIWCFKVGLN